MLEGEARLHNLPRGFVRAEINCRSHGHCAHVPRLFNVREIDLVELVRIGEQFVVVQFHEERDFVRVFAGHRAEHAERGGDGVAAAFDGKLHDVFGVETIRIFRKAGSGGMFDALVHRQDGHVARAGQPAMVEHRLQAAQRLRIAVGQRKNAVHEIRSRQMQPLLRHRLAFMFQQTLGGISQKFFNFSIHNLIISIVRIFAP